MSLMVPVDKLIKSLDTGGCFTSVFLDFARAFDTVDHDFFLQISEFYGSRGNALLWF